MNLTRTAFGIWSGGRFMHFGEALDDARYVNLVRRSYEKGTRTFVTADVYGAGRADSLLGEALKGIDRSTYSSWASWVTTSIPACALARKATPASRSLPCAALMGMRYTSPWRPRSHSSVVA